MNFCRIFIFRDFFLLGIICGLAIYNDNIVDLRFPLALYKKLLNVEPDVEDLEELHPSVGRSMKRVLERLISNIIPKKSKILKFQKFLSIM